MNPPLSTHIALIDAALQPFVDELSTISSCNGAVIYVRDSHYTNEAVALTFLPTDVANKRLEWIKDTIENRRVDLKHGGLDSFFNDVNKPASLTKSPINPAQILWNQPIALDKKHMAVIQVIFEKASPTPSLSTINKYWQHHKDDIIHSLIPLASLKTPSIADDCRALPPVTPNAFVIKWTIPNSGLSVMQNYGDFRHFMVTFMHAISALCAYHGGIITSQGGDGQNIVLYFPDTLNPYSKKDIIEFGKQSVAPLIEKIKRAHSSLAMHYDPQPSFIAVVGVGHVEISQHNEITGPLMWQISSKLKTLAGSSDDIAVAVENESRRYFEL